MNLKKIIKEEMEDLQWIIDTNPDEIKFNVGDRVMVHNMGPEKTFINWLGLYKENYLKGYYGENIVGVVDSMDKDFICLIVNGRDRIFFPNKRKENELNYQGFKNLRFYYEIIS